MTSDNSPDDLRSLWQAQPQATFQMSPDELQRRMKRLNRTLLIRDMTGWFVCVTEIAFFIACFILIPQTVARVGSVLIALGMAFMLGQVWLDQRRRRASRAAAETSGNINSLDYFRAELARQREFHRGVWFWSRMAALFPGMLVFGIGAIVVLPWPDNLVGYAITGVTVIICPIAIWLNLSKSKNYRCQIDALDALKHPDR